MAGATSNVAPATFNERIKIFSMPRVYFLVLHEIN